MNKVAFFIGIFALVLIGVWGMRGYVASPVGEKACTAEAKICPDGTAVGRGGPNCEFAACPAVVTTSATTTLAVGESAKVSGITLAVKGLGEDSRCPVDAQCIQAGTVRVSVSVDSYTGDLELTLGEPQVVKNSLLVLESVTPERRAKQTITPGEYRFTFTLVPLVASDPSAGIP
ncbi:MAG: hypothetical protein RLZZ26_654 [Candidatus Parcubacteria bacterium]|jgi:hypothetical protein